MEQDVFICHSSNDLDSYVRGIYDYLRKKGVECFCSSIVEEGYIRPGEYWMVSVERILNNCKYFIFVVSDKSLSSEQIIDELREAVDRHVVIIPYITEKHITWPNVISNNSLFDGIRMVLRHKQSINANGEPVSEQNLMKLVEVIKNDIRVNVKPAEETYKERVKDYLSDGKIDTIEKDALEKIAKNLNIIPKRAEELEKIAREELGSIWPAIGIAFLRNFYDKIQNEPFLKSLEFCGVKEIESASRLRWFLKRNLGFGIRIIRWGKKIKIRFGLFSENAIRDPEFRRLANDLCDQNLLNGFDFFPKNKLRVSYETKTVEPITLDQNEFRIEIYDKFIDFCKKIQPFLNLPITNNDKTPPKDEGQSVTIEDNTAVNDELYRRKVKEALVDHVTTDREREELDIFQNELKLSDEDALRIFDEVLEEMKKIGVADIAKPEQILTQKKVSLQEIDLALIQALQMLGGAAKKKDVEQKVYDVLQESFREPWYQEDSTPGIQRWKHQVNWARNRARERGLIKPTEESGQGYWELTEKGKKEPVPEM